MANEKVIEMHRSKIHGAANLLARAFWDDPMIVFLFPDVEVRREREPSFFSLNMEHAVVGGELYTTTSFRGISVWRFLGDETISRVDTVNDPRNRLPEAMGDGPFQRLMIIAKYTNEMHKRLVQKKHCYLLFLGVEPDQQGKGYGSLLIEPVIKRADKKCLSCYLETMKQSNLAFYRKHGFQVADEKQIPDSELHIWALLRSAT